MQSKGRFLHTRPQPIEPYYSYIANLTPRNGAIPLTQDGLARVCANCHDSLHQQFKDYSSAGVPELQRNYNTSSKTCVNNDAVTRMVVPSLESQRNYGGKTFVHKDGLSNAVVALNESQLNHDIGSKTCVDNDVVCHAAVASPLTTVAIVKTGYVLGPASDTVVNDRIRRGIKCPPLPVGDIRPVTAATNFCKTIVTCKRLNSDAKTVPSSAISNFKNGFATHVVMTTTAVCYLCASKIVHPSLVRRIRTSVDESMAAAESDLLLPFVAFLQCPEGASPPDAAGKVSVCVPCHTYLFAQWQKYEVDCTPVERRSFFLRMNHSPTGLRSPIILPSQVGSASSCDTSNTVHDDNKRVIGQLILNNSSEHTNLPCLPSPKINKLLVQESPRAPVKRNNAAFSPKMDVNRNVTANFSRNSTPYLATIKTELIKSDVISRHTADVIAPAMTISDTSCVICNAACHKHGNSVSEDDVSIRSYAVRIEPSLVSATKSSVPFFPFLARYVTACTEKDFVVTSKAERVSPVQAPHTNAPVSSPVTAPITTPITSPVTSPVQLQNESLGPPNSSCISTACRTLSPGPASPMVTLPLDAPAAPSVAPTLPLNRSTNDLSKDLAACATKSEETSLSRKNLTSPASDLAPPCSDPAPVSLNLALPCSNPAPRSSDFSSCSPNAVNCSSSVTTHSSYEARISTPSCSAPAGHSSVSSSLSNVALSASNVASLTLDLALVTSDAASSALSVTPLTLNVAAATDLTQSALVVGPLTFDVAPSAATVDVCFVCHENLMQQWLSYEQNGGSARDARQYQTSTVCCGGCAGSRPRDCVKAVKLNGMVCGDYAGCLTRDMDGAMGDSRWVVLCEACVEGVERLTVYARDDVKTKVRYTSLFFSCDTFSVVFTICK